MITSTTNGRSRLMGVMTKDRARVTSTTDKRVCKSFMLCEHIIYFHYITRNTQKHQLHDLIVVYCLLCKYTFVSPSIRIQGLTCGENYLYKSYISLVSWLLRQVRASQNHLHFTNRIPTMGILMPPMWPHSRQEPLTI